MFELMIQLQNSMNISLRKCIKHWLKYHFEPEGDFMINRDKGNWILIFRGQEYVFWLCTWHFKSLSNWLAREMVCRQSNLMLSIDIMSWKARIKEPLFWSIKVLQLLYKSLLYLLHYISYKTCLVLYLSKLIQLMALLLTTSKRLYTRKQVNKQQKKSSFPVKHILLPSVCQVFLIFVK